MGLKPKDTLFKHSTIYSGYQSANLNGKLVTHKVVPFSGKCLLNDPHRADKRNLRDKLITALTRMTLGFLLQPWFKYEYFMILFF